MTRQRPPRPKGRALLQSQPRHRLSAATMQTRRLLLSALLATGVLAALPAAAQSKDREYVVASSATYTPFAFENKDKQIVGFDIDIVNAIAQKEKMKLRIVNTPFTSIFASLNNAYPGEALPQAFNGPHHVPQRCRLALGVPLGLPGKRFPDCLASVGLRIQPGQ